MQVNSATLSAPTDRTARTAARGASVRTEGRATTSRGPAPVPPAGGELCEYSVATSAGGFHLVTRPVTPFLASKEVRGG